MKIPCIAKSLMPATTIITAFNGQGTGKSGDLLGVAQLIADTGVHPLPEDFPCPPATPVFSLAKVNLVDLN